MPRVPRQKKEAERAPRKLTPERTRTICDAIASGASFRTAAALAGVGERTLKLWKAKAKAQRRGIYREFGEAVALALATFEVNAVRTILAAGTNQRSWTALAWLLERRFPERWARPEVKARHYGGNGEEQGPRVTRMPIAGPIRIGMPFAPPPARGGASQVDKDGPQDQPKEQNDGR